LCGAARPVKNQTARDLIQRFQSLARSGLGSFEQSALSSEIHVFGNVAIAFGVCLNLKNRTVVVRGAGAFLLVKEEGAWKIAAQV